MARFQTERTYVMIKPDGVQRGLVGEIIGRFEKKGFVLKGLKMFHTPKDLAQEHYKVRRAGRGFPGTERSPPPLRCRRRQQAQRRPTESAARSCCRTCPRSPSSRTSSTTSSPARSSAWRGALPPVHRFCRNLQRKKKGIPARAPAVRHALLSWPRLFMLQVWEGVGAVKAARNLIGATNPTEARCRRRRLSPLVPTPTPHRGMTCDADRAPCVRFYSPPPAPSAGTSPLRLGAT